MSKARHLRVGERGESAAVEFLRSNGYKIVERNYRTKYSEMDIVAKSPKKRRIFGKSEPEVLHFVEVRTKTGEEFGSPEATIDREKRRRLERSAKAYTAFKKYNGPYQIDVICVVFNRDGSLRRLDHYENIDLD